MARARWKTNVVVRNVLAREISVFPLSTNVKNWQIIKTLITSKDGYIIQQIGKLQGAKSCSRIIYNEGYLIIKDVSTSNTLKIYNLNGRNRLPYLEHSLSLHDEWKDRSFGIGPVFVSANHIPHAHGFKTGLYYITSKKLHFLNLQNGAVSVETLPTGYKFTELTIDDETHILAVSSLKSPKDDILMVFALYHYYPCLVFDQLIQIQKSVFGPTLVGAEINQGLLLTLHKANKIKIYNLSAICKQQNQVPPVMLEIGTFNHLLAIGATPYYLLKATHFNSFVVQSMDDGRLFSSITGKPDSFDPYLGFHPDASSRLIFTDNGVLQLFNIVSKDEITLLVPGHVHSLSADVKADEPTDQSSSTTTTASGRVVRKRINSSVYSQTSDDDDTVHLAWDYEDDLGILGVLYARQTVERRQHYVQLTLDLIDSSSGKRLKRFHLEPNIRISSFESTEVFLRLDADQCIISISRSSTASLFVFRFISLCNS